MVTSKDLFQILIIIFKFKFYKIIFFQNCQSDERLSDERSRGRSAEAIGHRRTSPHEEDASETSTEMCKLTRFGNV